MKIITILLILVMLLSVEMKAQVRGSSRNQEAPADFTGDGCTFFPDGNYVDCCRVHDRDYYRGGSGKDRLAADRRLFKCVFSKKGWQNKIAAPLMWLGVTTSAFFPMPVRWGYGTTNDAEFQKSVGR